MVMDMAVCLLPNGYSLNTSAAIRNLKWERNNAVTIADKLGNIVHWIWKFKCSYTASIPRNAAELVT